MKTVAIVQARLASRRLPGKVLADLHGRPMLDHVLERAAAIPCLAELCLNVPATNPSLARQTCKTYLMPHQEEDVLASFLAIAEKEQADVVVRLTGDCPFLDPHVSGQVVALLEDSGVEYCCNCNVHTGWADGLDTEVFTIDALRLAVQSTTDPLDREHVGRYMAMHALRTALASPQPMARYKWSVDTEADLARARRMTDFLTPGAWSWTSTLAAWTAATNGGHP